MSRLLGCDNIINIGLVYFLYMVICVLVLCESPKAKVGPEHQRCRITAPMSHNKNGVLSYHATWFSSGQNEPSCHPRTVQNSATALVVDGTLQTKSENKKSPTWYRGMGINSQNPLSQVKDCYI